jgi:hypothetical protein
MESKLKAVRVRKSMEAMVAMANSCFPIGPKNSTKKNWIADKELYLGDISGIERILTPVYIATDEHKTTLLMDAITGTLYRPRDGKCMTSDKLVLKKYEKVDGLDKRLMKIRSEQFLGDDE